MSGRSLRLRLIAGGVVAILAALGIASVGLMFLFERHIARTIADDLDVHLKQLIAGIDIGAEDQLIVVYPHSDPRFAEPLSGLYSQITSNDGQLLRSRSLWDTTLFLPNDELSPGEVHRHTTLGPAKTRLLIAERGISLMIKGHPAAVHIAVAVEFARVSAVARAFAKELAIALGLLALVLAIGTSIQVGLGLRPLSALRRDIADIRSGRHQRLPSAAPVEVQPLVDEVNGLLDTQEPEIERSRSRAADLAHGLKTPLAALASDADRLRELAKHNNCYRIVPFHQLSPALTAGTGPTAGGLALADPRPVNNRQFQNIYRVAKWTTPTHTVIGAAAPADVAISVAHPRWANGGRPKDHYLTGGHNGVLDWNQSSGTISAAACHDNGFWSLADPRLPNQTDRFVAVIEALDGTWHRPSPPSNLPPFKASSNQKNINHFEFTFCYFNRLRTIRQITLALWLWRQ